MPDNVLRAFQRRTGGIIAECLSMGVTSIAAAVGAYLTLLQPDCLDAVGCAQTSARSVPIHGHGNTGSSQQQRAVQSHYSQQHPHQQQPAPSSIGQACLLASVWAPLGGQQLRPPQHQQQQLLLCQHHHPWQQLWPSQWRAVSSSAAVCGSSSRDSPPTWPEAVPPLHQPSKHVTGTHPLKARPIRGAPEAAAAAAEQTAALAETPTVLPAQESVFMRHRAKVIMLLLFLSTGATLALICLEVMLGSLPGQLGCGDAVVQKIGLRTLQQRVLRLRPLPVIGGIVVEALVERHVLAALVALLQPGTDAVVLVETCEIIKGLLDSPLALAAMQQAGLSEAVNMGLKEGWIPTGALQTARSLQKRLLFVCS